MAGRGWLRNLRLSSSMTSVGMEEVGGGGGGGGRAAERGRPLSLSLTMRPWVWVVLVSRAGRDVDETDEVAVAVRVRWWAEAAVSRLAVELLRFSAAWARAATLLLEADAAAAPLKNAGCFWGE